MLYGISLQFLDVKELKKIVVGFSIFLCFLQHLNMSKDFFLNLLRVCSLFFIHGPLWLYCHTVTGFGYFLQVNGFRWCKIQECWYGNEGRNIENFFEARKVYWLGKICLVPYILVTNTSVIYLDLIWCKNTGLRPYNRGTSFQSGIRDVSPRNCSNKENLTSDYYWPYQCWK